MWEVYRKCVCLHIALGFEVYMTSNWNKAGGERGGEGVSGGKEGGAKEGGAAVEGRGGGMEERGTPCRVWWWYIFDLFVVVE